MALDCNGSFSGVGPDGAVNGTWGGSYDDGPLTALIRESGTSTYNKVVEFGDVTLNINASVIGQYSIIQNLSTAFGTWKGSGSYTDQTWSDTCHQLDLVNEQTSEILVEILQYYNELSSRLGNINIKCENIQSTLSRVEGKLSALDEKADTILDKLKLYGRRIVGSLASCVECLLEPFYRICKPSVEEAFRVSVDSELQPTVTRQPSPSGSGHIAYSTYDDDYGLTLFTYELEDYGRFHAFLGDNYYYYSSELSQILSRPFRYGDKVSIW